MKSKFVYYVQVEECAHEKSSPGSQMCASNLLAPVEYTQKNSSSPSNKTNFRYARESSLGATRRSGLRRSLLTQPLETYKPIKLFTHSSNALRSQKLHTGRK